MHVNFIGGCIAASIVTFPLLPGSSPGASEDAIGNCSGALSAKRKAETVTLDSGYGSVGGASSSDCSGKLPGPSCFSSELGSESESRFSKAFRKLRRHDSGSSA